MWKGYILPTFHSRGSLFCWEHCPLIMQVTFHSISCLSLTPRSTLYSAAIVIQTSTLHLNGLRFLPAQSPYKECLYVPAILHKWAYANDAMQMNCTLWCYYLVLDGLLICVFPHFIFYSKILIRLKATVGETYPVWQLFSVQGWTWKKEKKGENHHKK